MISFSFYFFYFLRNRLQIVKYFLILQALCLYCILANIFYMYIGANLSRPSLFFLIWYPNTFAWAVFFLYYYGLFYLNLAGSMYLRSKKRIYLFFAIAVGLTGIIPFLTCRTPDEMIRGYETIRHFILYPANILVILSGIYMMITRYNKIENKGIRMIIRIDLILKAVDSPLIIFILLSNFGAEELRNKLLYINNSLYFSAILIAGFVIAVRFANNIKPEIFKKLRMEDLAGDIREAGKIISNSIRKYEKSSLNREIAENGLKILERYMQREKPYLDPELTLPSLAGQLSIPRNRLSQILNEYKKMKFNDFLNEFRVEEAKKLLAANKGNILRIAFDSGFNSKSSFYYAFRKITGKSPKELLPR